ncbi:MAG: 2-oxo acid dehydrogenase subunit E2 [Pseudomonadota bacterium]
MTAEPASSAQKLPMLRKMIAKHMMNSLQSAAQLTYFADADVTALLSKRQQWKKQGIAIGIEDCVLAVLSRALGDHPEFNATLERDEVLLHSSQDIAIALATPSGLVTPIIRGLETLSLQQISEQRRDLVKRGLEGKLKVLEMKGGSFTISNLGLTRIKHFTPILNAPQVALLGLGKIDQRCVPSDQDISVRAFMGLSLTADHQWLDGAPCGDFLGDICTRLERFDIAL